jgi:hypothetical protein
VEKRRGKRRELDSHASNRHRTIGICGSKKMYVRRNRKEKVRYGII